jgi:benzoyl-CoA reductase/2-hydroxyglutaryl-CoA dehydratase subunit BcrC/BadD/HgdB
MPVVGITALIPPEIIYSTGNTPLDVNNFVPLSREVPKDKLCAWTAVWRELALMGQIKMDKLVVVSGGDCNNAVVDGEKLERSGIETHYFMYPFDGSHKAMKEEILKLVNFLGGGVDKSAFKNVGSLKQMARDIDLLRIKGEVSSADGFSIEISGSDLTGDLEQFERKVEGVKKDKSMHDYKIALLGTPPIYRDFHQFLESLGMHVVYDEMPYEFIRHGGGSIDEIARDYSEYTFARNISHRIRFIEKELKDRGVDGVIHFHQFACHHKLEDSILRKALGREGYPYITIEADLPSKTPQQTTLRLEAFKERLGEFS